MDAEAVYDIIEKNEITSVNQMNLILNHFYTVY